MTSVTRSDGIVDINYYVDIPTVYMYICSPVSTFVNACNVYPEGNVGNRDSGGVGNLNESYGRKSPGTVTNLDAFITTTTGDVSHAGNTSIYAYSYGKLFKYL